jgi:hypothetical protein
MRSSEKPANLTPEDVVNAFLVERFGVCLEDVISDAAAGVIRAQLSPIVEATSSCLARWHDEDGALAELFGGLLAVDGVRYAWRARSLPISTARGTWRIWWSSDRWTGPP